MSKTAPSVSYEQFDYPYHFTSSRGNQYHQYHQRSNKSPSFWIFTQAQVIFLGTFLVGLLLHRLGLSLWTVVLHPEATLRGLLEMASHKLGSIAGTIGFGGLGNVDWEKVGVGLRGDGDLNHYDGDGLQTRNGDKSLFSDDSITRSRRHEAELRDLALLEGGGSGRYYPGLLNAAGNLCFLNATLQSMASTHHLLIYLKQILDCSLEISRSSSIPVTTTLLRTLVALNTPSSSSHPPPLRPLELAEALANSSALRKRLLSSSEQQDAHELWGMIREAVEEEALRLEKFRADLSAGNGGLAEVLKLAKSGGRAILGHPETTASSTVEIRLSNRRSTVKDPFLHLVSQRVKCMVCGYTRDVRHTSEAQVQLIVPYASACSLHDLLSEFTKMELIADYSCRRCTLKATHEKLIAQRDRLALVGKNSNTNRHANATPSPAEHLTSVVPPSKPSPNQFDVLLDGSNPTLPDFTPSPPVMTQSRKDRKRKVQKLVDKLGSMIEAGDYERDVMDGVKIERVSGPAGKQVRFARTPDVLTFHLNRSNHFGRGGAYKNTCQVGFPEYLDLGEYCDNSTSPPTTPQVFANMDGILSNERPLSKDIFRLSSLVVHYGTHSFGHYVAFRRRPRPLRKQKDSEGGVGMPEWYRISDETVEPASLNEAMRANPFLLFYERVFTCPAPPHYNSDARVSEDYLKSDAEIDSQSYPIVPRVFESWRLKSWESNKKMNPSMMQAT